MCHAPGRPSIHTICKYGDVTHPHHPPTHTHHSCLSGDYRVEEVGVPEVGEGELLVKVLAVGICAGDAKCFAGAPYFWGECVTIISPNVCVCVQVMRYTHAMWSLQLSPAMSS